VSGSSDRKLNKLRVEVGKSRGKNNDFAGCRRPAGEGMHLVENGASQPRFRAVKSSEEPPPCEYEKGGG